MILLVDAGLGKGHESNIFFESGYVNRMMGLRMNQISNFELKFLCEGKNFLSTNFNDCTEEYHRKDQNQKKSTSFMEFMRIFIA